MKYSKGRVWSECRQKKVAGAIMANRIDKCGLVILKEWRIKFLEEYTEINIEKPFRFVDHGKSRLLGGISA